MFPDIIYSRCIIQIYHRECFLDSVYEVSQNLQRIRAECSSIMSQSGWKQPSIKHHQRAIDVLSSPGRKLHSYGSGSAKVPPFPPLPPPSEAESLTSNLLERNQNVRQLCNLQADECGLYFIYNFSLQISSFCLTMLDLQRLNTPSPPPLWKRLQ